MNYQDLSREGIRSIPVYQPGRPVELVARELGMDPEKVLKLASNENPLGASPKAVDAAKRAMGSVAYYPDNSGYFLTQAISEKFGFGTDQITLAAGSNEIFYRLCDLFVDEGKEVVMGKHAFVSYKIATLLAGGIPVEVPMPDLTHDPDAMLAATTDQTRLIFLPNPNNPTGTRIPSSAVETLIERLPDHVILCYDEAYFEYDEDPVDLQKWIQADYKVIGTRTFSKIYGLAGLRIGYGYSHPDLAALLNRIRPPFNTSSVAQEAALAALDDDDWVRKSFEANRSGLVQLENGLKKLGLDPVPSSGNFTLVPFRNPDKVCQELLMNGIIVRPVAGYDLPNHLRISVGTESGNSRLLQALETIIS